MASEAKLVGVKINGQTVYVSRSGEKLRIGSRGSLVCASICYRMLGKGPARALRKTLHKAGYAKLAAMPALALPF